jgi:drug/metabolite transporter (DMT)-like permease
VRLRDAIELVVLAALFGGSYLFMRVAAPVLGPLPVSAARVTIAALLLLPLVAARGGAGELRARAGPIAVMGAINSALPFALIAYATLSLSAGFAAILNATSPLWGALVAHLWLGERLGRVRVAGLVLGFAGVVLLVWGKGSLRAGGGLAMVASLAAPLSYAVAASATKRYLGGASPLAVAAGSQVAAAAMLLPIAAAAWPRGPASSRVWGAVVALGVACTAIAYTMYYRLIRNIGPTRALAVTFLVPVFAAAWGWLFLGEAVTGSMVLGGLVILAGTALATGLVAPRAVAIPVPRATGRGGSPR